MWGFGNGLISNFLRLENVKMGERKDLEAGFGCSSSGLTHRRWRVGMAGYIKCVQAQRTANGAESNNGFARYCIVSFIVSPRTLVISGACPKRPL
jgi:hypothetical protein